jgi:hypothetical protein
MMQLGHLTRLTCSVFAAGLLVLAHTSHGRATTPRFYPDDPLAIEPETQDASGVRPWDIGLTYDMLESMFADRGDRSPNVPAMNVNTIGEVPDSSWFTNRLGTRHLTAADVARGPDTVSGPAPGRWTITAAKSDGITPGFTIEDLSGERWFIKFDPPGYRAMATGAEVIVTKLLWALGYHVPENYIATLRRDDLVVGDSAIVSPPGARPRTMLLRDVDALLARAERNADGSYRVLASRALPGTPLGGFRFYGTRPDDPNDVIPHEHRRELRGYRVFAAWVNHVDSKSINTLDTLVPIGGRSIVRHHLLDFGSTLGSGAVHPREAWEGYEHLFEGGAPTLRRLVRVGLPVPQWRTMPFFEAPSVGRFPLDNTRWDPDGWRPRATNPAFLRTDAADRFWAATKLAAMTDEMIEAAVSAGRLGDEESEVFLTRALIERRNAILRAYLPVLNPIVAPTLSSSSLLSFHNIAVQAGVAAPPDGYRVSWSVLDNATGMSRSLGESSGLQAPTGLPDQPGQLVGAAIRANGGGHPGWEHPVQAYFRLDHGEWKLVGLER